MSDEAPSFSVKSLDESMSADAPKKSTRKKRVVRTSLPKNKKQAQMARQLTQIYQDNDGRLPDMRKIKIKRSHPGLKTFFVVLIFGGLLSAAAWAGFLLMPNDKKFSENQINLNIDGPKNVTAGTTTTYKISYENNQNLILKKATLNVQYPEGFIFLSSDTNSKNSGHTEWDLGEIGAREKNEIVIVGLTYGSLNQKQSWRVFLKYQPENFGSELQKASILDVTIEKSPFSLAVNGPSKTLIGNASEYTFTVKKEYDSQINKLELKSAWPQNFFITSSSPALNKDNKWIIEPNKIISSSTANRWVFKITGKFSPAASGTLPQDGGSSGDISGALFTKVANSTFALANAKTTIELTQNDLDFNLAINGSLANLSSQPGDNLNITISLKNQSANDLKNVILKLALDAPSVKKQSLLDWAKLEDKYDGDVRGIQLNDALRRGEITWNKNKIPDLAKINKNKELSLDMRLPIRQLEENSTFNLSDLNTSSQITVLAEVSFKDASNISRTYSSNQIIITVNSDLKFETRDSVSADNAKHQIIWMLTNNFHHLKNLALSADIYGDVTVEPTATPTAGEVKYDSATKKIVWTIPEMPDSVDVLALPITITLNSINPTQELLVSKTHVQAEDAVTGEKLDFMGDETRLR